VTAPSNNTPFAIINDAYHDAGLLQSGEVVNSTQVTDGQRRLTDLINVTQTAGLKLWLNVDTEITLVANQGTYSLGPSGDEVMVKPLRAVEAYYMDSTGIRRPLVPMSWNDYIRLSQVNQSGAINSYFINKKQSELSVFFWLIPDATAATGTAHLLLQTQVSNLTNVTDEMNFPIEWRIYLRWGLADEICTGQPQAIMDRCQQRAMMYKEQLEGWDVEDAPTRFTPDQRSNYFGGRFR